MRNLLKYIPLVLIFIALFLLFYHLAHLGNLQLLNPQGSIAQKQSRILIGALILAMCIGIPTVLTTFFIAFRYREGNKKTVYTPNWTSSKGMMAIWWTVPAILILIFSIINWKTAHELDPYQQIPSSVKPITIQVVALQWKWLFIYPEEKIATVNFIEIPINTPVQFQLTADGPMNIFWIPSLGSQISAMAGMVTQEHLMATKTGNFPGTTTEINGEGYSGMNFITRATSTADYHNWLQIVKHSGKLLTRDTYHSLVKPSTNNPEAFYVYADQNLYNEIIMKYMAPSKSPEKEMPMNMTGQ